MSHGQGREGRVVGEGQQQVAMWVGRGQESHVACLH